MPFCVIACGLTWMQCIAILSFFSIEVQEALSDCCPLFEGQHELSDFKGPKQISQETVILEISQGVRFFPFREQTPFLKNLINHQDAC
jgi:hypothetical protein